MQLNPQIMTAPTKVIIGPGTVDGVGNEIKRIGGTRVLIVTDEGVLKAGLVTPVIKALEAQGITSVLYVDVQPDPPSRLVSEGVSRLKSEKCDFVLGIGGGSSLDTAKGIAILAANSGHILDFCGLEQVPQKGLPMILIPTTAGTGSEVTRIVVLTDEANGIKKSINSLYALPDVAIVDPQLMVSLPAHLTAETGIDALTHALEAYVAPSSGLYSDLLAEKAMELLITYLPMAYAKRANLIARCHVAEASTLAGLAFMSSFVGGVHGMAHALGATYHLPHGRACAVMLPHVMRFNVPAAPHKFCRIAQLLGENTQSKSELATAESAVPAICKLIATLDIPLRLRDYNIPEEGIEKLVAASRSEERFFIANPRDMNEDDIRKIFTDAY